MSLKIFLPKDLFYIKENREIYGAVIQNESRHSVSYYITPATSPVVETASRNPHKIEYLGVIRSSREAPSKGHLEARKITFLYNEHSPNIQLAEVLVQPSGRKDSNANVFLYEPHRILQLYGCTPIEDLVCGQQNEIDDISILYHLLKDEFQQDLQSKNSSMLYIRKLLAFVFNLPLDLMTTLFMVLMECKPIMLIMRFTVFYEHYKEWRKFRESGKRNVNIKLDKVLGVLVMLLLLFYVPRPGDHVIRACHFIISKLSVLLQSLKGSPIGLKLNVHLNNFFLDCFNYHIDLWATFLRLIEPSVQLIFVPITLLGSMGLSCQLALLADLLSVMGLHAHCFYIYAAILYKVELQGLQTLWRVVRGKRFNVLKKRVESHDYMNRQLYLATIFFTTMLFLFPTIMVYYVVFTTLRLVIYMGTSFLQYIRRRILEFPLENLFDWLRGNFNEISSLKMQYLPNIEPQYNLENTNANIQVAAFKIDVHSSSLGRVFSCKSGVILQENPTVLNEKKSSGDSIFKRILVGQF